MGTWGAETAVVPVLMEHSGSRALIPYILSFVSSLYRSQRTGIVVDLRQMTEGGVENPIECTAYLLPRAGQVVVAGPTNVLLVVVDFEVHSGETVFFNVDQQALQVVGRATRDEVGADIRVRTLVDVWLGPENSAARRPPGRQRDAYEALEMLHRMVGTAGAFDAALNVATEVSRVIPLGGGVNALTGNTYGMACVGQDVAGGGGGGGSSAMAGQE
ncbi:hypothetical protein MTO96_032250 [Rhipicephalus appendiculatus]